MVIKNDTYAVALPLVDINFHSAKEVLDAHLEKAEESGSVYFSTSNRLDPKKVKQVTKVILVNKSFSYIADLVGYKYFDEKSASSLYFSMGKKHSPHMYIPLVTALQ